MKPAAGPKPKPVAVVLTMTNGAIEDPGPVRCEPGNRLTFVVVNEDATDYDVAIDPDEVLIKWSSAKPGKPPVQHPKKPHTVKAGDVELIRQRVLKEGEFGNAAGQIPYTTYKYTIRWSWKDGSGATHTGVLDPDVDVAPPN